MLIVHSLLFLFNLRTGPISEKKSITESPVVNKTNLLFSHNTNDNNNNKMDTNIYSIFSLH